MRLRPSKRVTRFGWKKWRPTHAQRMGNQLRLHLERRRRRR